MEKVYEAIRRELTALAEPEFARFSAGLLRKPQEEAPSGTAARMLGVRLPALRRMAKRLSKEDWRGSLNALSGHIQNSGREREETGSFSFEEVMLWGFLIGNAVVEKAGGSAGKKSGREVITPEEQFTLIRRFVPFIDNWSLCDSFCAGLKSAKEYPEETWAFLQPFLRSEEEYGIRFGVVMILNYFVTEEYIDRLFPLFDGIRHEGYYVKMAVAWAVSACYVKFPQKTQAYLEQNSLDLFTYHKALQKITESRCVSDEVRQRMKQMKRQDRS